ncbi:hypothetical protein L210DRAFT_3535424 [Boletus edulis BED1]|uniref:Secreted protein n=1 Tax=Boletus edulis BED1 TaxID=1328754 RepID=A0AAD4GH44_BOLED|nr:hypothetical protein L210DRAFT_3535424 [Boletus edulis BED1]
MPPIRLCLLLSAPARDVFFAVCQYVDGCLWNGGNKCMVYTVVQSDRVNAEVGVRAIPSRLSVRTAGGTWQCCSGYYVQPKGSHVLSVHSCRRYATSSRPCQLSF